MSYLKIYSKSGGHAPISAVHVIRQLINSLNLGFLKITLVFDLILTALNRPTIASLILKHWGPNWVENGIKWVNRKIGVHVGRPK